ncbi:MAG: RsmD family RNA methyltransferase [Candidatus Azosocius agrarius]|nr:MAG: RsmD family RNA methyltransferase [Gammaproteobacteria bacterium]
MNKIKLLSGYLKGKEILYYSHFVKPTIFIIRKILFDWIKDIINKSRILDMFGGSGVLGFEALSRGASYLFIVEKSFAVCNSICLNIQNLNIKNVNIINIDVFEWLNLLQLVKSYIKSFDIIFIDPPYNSNYLFYCLNFLLINNYITNDTYIYIESYINFEIEFVFFKYKILKFKNIGNIKFYLIKKL